jgi:hypothetical protein
MNILFYPFLVAMILILGIALSFNSILIKKNSSLFLKFSTSYFVGISFIIVILKSYDFLIKNLFIANHLLILTIFLIIVYKKNNLISFYKDCKFFFNLKIILLNILLFFFVAALLFSVWMDNKYYIPEYLNNVGSLHSGKYVWLSNYIGFCNKIPIIGQNTGQSILTYFFGFITNNNRPYLFLYLWLVLTSYFLIVYFFSFLNNYFSLNYKLSFLGTFFLMFGGTALSLTHVLVVDSGSPFILNGYTDTLFGVFSLILLYNIFLNIKEDQKVQLFDLILILILLGCNFFTAPQNIVFFFACLIFFILDTSVILNLKKKIMTVFMLSLILFVPQGGMLTPSVLQNDLKAEEVTNFSVNKNSKFYSENFGSKNLINIYPGYPFFYDGINDWKSGQASLLKDGLNFEDNFKNNFFSLTWILEKIFLNSLLVLFFPTIGMILLINYYIKKNFLFSKNKKKIRFLIVISILAFLFGVLFTFFISIKGYKWELSRFMIPFITFGMLSFFLTLIVLFKSSKILILLIFISVFGPIISQSIKSISNINNLPIDRIVLLIKDYSRSDIVNVKCVE